jgi:hypothetical protein
LTHGYSFVVTVSNSERHQRGGNTQAGVIPTSTNAVLCEIHRTWNRPEAAELAKLYTTVAPNYAALMESYQRAQDVIKQHRVVTGIPPKRESL